MSDQTVFNSDDQTQTQQISQQTTDATLLEALVGEGKKYKTVEELAKGYHNADSFLETLKDENRTLREQVTKVADLDATIQRMQAQAKVSSPNVDNGEVEQTTSVNADDIAKLIEKSLAEREAVTKLQGNLKTADTRLKEVFGDKAKEVFDKHAATPALKATLTTLAQENPEAFVQYFVNLAGDKQQVITSTTDGGTKVNTVNLNSVYGNREGDPETKEYYNALRQKDPSKYYSQAVQIQMNNAAIKNSQKFFGKTN